MNGIYLDATQNELTIKVPFTFKVFKINDIEILSSGDIIQATIYYRYSQDNGRTISDWVKFTKENIRSERINPIRFFQIEYYIIYSGTSNVKIFDINLIGDFQNITLDNTKTNLFGVREDCNCLMLNIVNDPAAYQLAQDQLESKTSMLLSPGSADLYTLTPADVGALYQPYAQSLALTLLNKLSNDAVDIFGHDVVYFLTDPDKNGTDHTFHEYQLQNYVCDAMIKVSVENNQFPDNQIVFNQFDLSLFDSFEVHITKQDFKAAFGEAKRPGKDDFLWFCELNRVYRIEHAQPFKNFNNYVLYYKLILTKYNEKANIIGANQEIQDKIDAIMDNSTIAELMGLENIQDKKAVANTEQLRTQAQDTLRNEIFATVEKEKIENASLTISKHNYDMSTVDYGTPGVVYRNFKNFYQKSDNIGFTCWFNINNINVNEIYNFFNYYDYVYNTGIKIDMIGTSIIVKINAETHDMPFDSMLSENIWYCLVVNLNQRQSNLSYNIFKRNSAYENEAQMLNSSVLRELYTGTKTIVPTIIELEPTINASILGSDMKITNIKMFNDVIPLSNHKLLNMDIIDGNYKYAIFSDNANKIFSLPFYTDSKTDYTKIRRGTELDDGSINNEP